MLQVELRELLGVGEATPETRAEKGAFGAVWAATSVTRTVLVVDDDETIRELVAAVLQYQGYRLRTAGSGLEGLSILRQQRVDLLITDVEMPLLDGRQLARRARRLRPHLPILFVSGGTVATSLERNVHGGPCALLRKPFTFARLVSLVEELLRRSSAVAQFPRAAG